MRKIIGLTGKAGSGKTTIAQHLVAKYSYREMSCAEPLKLALAAMGLKEPDNRADKEKPVPGFTFTWREAAQKLGTEFGRGLDPDFWVKILRGRLRRSSDTVVISDIRFTNEAEMIRSVGGILLFVTGRQVDLGANAGHASEAGVEFLPSVDALIDNSGDFEFTKQQVLEAIQRAA